MEYQKIIKLLENTPTRPFKLKKKKKKKNESKDMLAPVKRTALVIKLNQKFNGKVRFYDYSDAYIMIISNKDRNRSSLK